MGTTTTSPESSARPSRLELERYIELGALELLLTSDCALAPCFDRLLKTVNLTDGMNLAPHGGGPDLSTAFAVAIPSDDDTLERMNGPDRLVMDARKELLVETMLRSITPEAIDQATDYFHTIAMSKLEQAGAQLDGASDA